MKRTNENILYLLEMGMDDNRITGDIKNHRVRVLENIDILYKGEKFNMFFEFCQWTRYTYRTTNKRTGEPLKKAVKELANVNAVSIDTEYEREETGTTGYKFKLSYRNSKLEHEFYEENKSFTRSDILEIVNRYKIGAPFTKVILVEEETRKIIEKIGGYRERDIIAKRDFQTAGDHYYKVGQWDENYKIVEVIRREWEPTENGRKLKETTSCSVNLVSKTITG